MTADQKRWFLTELGRSGNLSFACKAAGCNRAQAYADRAMSTNFDLLWVEAARHARATLAAAIAAR